MTDVRAGGRQLLTMTLSDLRQRIRDKSVIIFAILVPLALMFVLNLVLGGLLDSKLKPITVAASATASDPVAVALVDVVEGLDGQSGLAVTVDRLGADATRSRVADGKAALGIIVPDGFGASLAQGEPTQVTVIQGDGAGIETQVVITVVKGTLDRLAAGTVAAVAAAGAGVSPTELAAIGQEVATAAPTVSLAQGTASNEQLSSTAALVAGQAGLFLFFTVGFGVLALVAERDQGTLARLRSMPMRPSLIVTAKALVSFVLGVVATSLLLAVGGRLFGVGFGSPVAVGILIVCAVTAATSVMFVIARVARTSEQASIAQSIVAMVLGIAGGAFFPLAVGGLLGSVLDLNPVAAFIRGLGITSGGGGVADIGVPVATLLVFAVIMIAVSRVVPDRGAAL